MYDFLFADDICELDVLYCYEVEIDLSIVANE